MGDDDAVVGLTRYLATRLGADPNRTESAVVLERHSVATGVPLAALFLGATWREDGSRALSSVSTVVGYWAHDYRCEP